MAIEKIRNNKDLLEFASERGFIINMHSSENIIHTPDCYFIRKMKPKRKEGGIYFAEKIGDIISSFNGLVFYKCFYCRPTIDMTEKEGKSITLREKKSNGLPMWNLAMPPFWEQYYHRKLEEDREIYDEVLGDAIEAWKDLLKLFMILMVFLFLILLFLSKLWEVV